jgi:hypothetical protein
MYMVSECPANSYGEGCAHVCDCAHGMMCEYITGQCRCQENYTGSKCETG